MSDAEWRIEFATRAARDVRRLDPPLKRRVVAALERLSADDPSVDVKRLVNSDLLRLRVGDLRVIFERRDSVRVVYVLRVLPRGRAAAALAGGKRLLLTDLVLAECLWQAEATGVNEVLSFDRSIDRIETITRREP